MNQRRKLIGLAVLGVGAALSTQVKAQACRLDAAEEARTESVIDARTLRLDDGREVRLDGIELAAASPSPGSASARLGQLVLGQRVTLHGADDAPDRYGRQHGFLFVEGAGASVQEALIGEGLALWAGTTADAGCADALKAAEAGARSGRRGIWRNAAVIKNAESSDDILADLGQFAVVEGRPVSVRQAGATLYVNFGRRWTRDFAVTISKRAQTTLSAAGLTQQTLEGQRMRVRGWVERRGGPRIDVTRVGQVELIGQRRDKDGQRQ